MTDALAVLLISLFGVLYVGGIVRFIAALRRRDPLTHGIGTAVGGWQHAHPWLGFRLPMAAFCLGTIDAALSMSGQSEVRFTAGIVSVALLAATTLLFATLNNYDERK